MYFIRAYPPTKTCQPPTRGISHISGYYTSPSHTSTIPDTPHTLLSPPCTHTHTMHTCTPSPASSLSMITLHRHLDWPPHTQSSYFRHPRITPTFQGRRLPPTPARTLSPPPGSIMRVTLTARGGKAGGSLPGVTAPFPEVRPPWGTGMRGDREGMDKRCSLNTSGSFRPSPGHHGCSPPPSSVPSTLPPK